MFSRIAIVNRGEAAMRLIHAVRGLSAETGQPIEVIALHTDVDAAATFVREADIAYDLGPAASRPYLNMKVLERALLETGADAAWVGWGFVAEDPVFAELCERIGVTFVGPSPDAMRKLGDKIGAKLIAEEVGVPVAPWSRGAVDTIDDALAAAADISYPLMLKATAGGGGRGIRVVNNDEELRDAYERTRDEAARAFGSGVVFLERLVTGARHVEVQVIADGQGTAWALGVRDCSVQRRNQKVVEESASPVLGEEQVAELKASAERLAVAVGYRGAATVEFLYHPGEKLFAFLEVNTRLQVEHPITEITNGFDLVRAQLHVASGGKLEGEPPTERGHAIEARLNAEDPDRDFAPAPGRINLLELPAGPGIRVDTGVSEGDTIPADFDSMIAKIIAYGRDRDEALGRLRRAVRETRVIIAGGSTNKSFVLELLDQPEVIDGSADTGWIDRVRAEGGLVANQHSAIALTAAAIDAYEEEEKVEQQRLMSTASGGRPQVQHESGRPLDLKLRGANYRVRVARIGAHRFRVSIEAGTETRTADVELERFDEHAAQLVVNRERFRLVTDTHGPVHLVDVDGITHRVSRDEGGVVRSPAPALVVATPLQVGDEVEAGAPVLVLESMKMETVLRAPVRSRLKESLVSVGTQVETGATLLRLEPLTEDDGDEAPEEVAGVDLDLPTEPEVEAHERTTRTQEDLRAQLLGFDVDSNEATRLLDDYLAVRRAVMASGRRPLADELELITVFADLAELSQNRPSSDELGVEHVHSARENFHTYLQSLDVERDGLPAAFHDQLSRALRHYGVTELDRTPELEAAVFRIFLALQNPAGSVTVITTLLREWLQEPTPRDELRDDVGPALDRLIAATQMRYPAIADLARGVVYAWYGQPLLLRDRARVYSNVRKQLRYLDENPNAADRDERVDNMVRSTEPLVRLLGQRIERGTTDNQVMLEVLTRRYYGNKGLSDIRNHEAGGTTFVVADRDSGSLMSAAVGFAGLPAALNGLGELARGAAAVDADIYLSWEQQPSGFDALAETLHETISNAALPPQVHRVTITVAGRGDARMHHHVTFRQSATGMAEERLIRGLHPHIAQRMRMERLRKFDLTRLPSADDEEVYLFRCVARENPSDERLIAFAQVRDLTAVREPGGRLLTLPTAEATLASCADSIRRAQRGAARPSSTNRIVLYVWPPIDDDASILDTIADHISGVTRGIGLEEVQVIARRRNPDSGELTKVSVHFSLTATGEFEVKVTAPTDAPIEPVDEYRQKVKRAAARNTVYPYELAEILGDFTEYDLDAEHRLVPVDRPKGRNTAAMVAGVVTTPTEKFPEGVTRVVLLGDPTKSLGALSEPECSRVIAALDLAEQMQVPLEWYALSSGARISMDSGTENMDWVARALKRVVEYTQDGGEINIVVAGINVGAQPYWNAEATMLMHTKGILVMTPDSAMVLTGKQSLDFSGGVSAEDNFGIGGFDRVMGPNGQAQYWAPNLGAARDVLMSHYEHTYVLPGEGTPRRADTADPSDRDVSDYPHVLAGSDFTTVGQIFSREHNPDRKKPFDIRTVIRAVADQDHVVLERWAGMADAETAVVCDVHLGGIPVCMLGIESREVARRGYKPTDGPDTYTAGTLFPQSSKKAARAINVASGNRPLVVLANLSGFDGSPESMRKLQLEYGAEIGRAIVNFRGPIVFCVISRYHGGAFVVFSKALNPNMTVLAIDGSFASVLGGAPAAAVVFAGEVAKRVAADPRVRELETSVAESFGTDRSSLNAELADIRQSVRAEKISEIAAEFDKVHSIQRAVEVGSVDAVIRAEELRPRIIGAIENSPAWGKKDSHAVSS
ncbi:MULTISPECIES: ATP-binding protein [Gordonia]|uniref:Acetyl-CoA carboxylase n=2 Tax=Gordonia alkanivorans TaxID=84096 RepID=W9DI96_9ACTN|nr:MULTISPECIES: carboxyl transferase domain-containing protein [Gordonia]ETA08189.1 acetyl-CoA carboxylase [Gordonia alkanivorans CGMCC 6845]MDH3006212.1 carboxyl transferase domain-containing protein [Gordonia alkanivorans]MDH3012848.1 carboxyl transferase domain-containing protein [Gordonia alkanivorans]MDH3015967.1 carboxyl transferase domain-containing protein [Gordonia alkanivorans]MDH3021680.1 carboxyl transferase domain-containing protein [Gordonia alkanivorans]